MRKRKSGGAAARASSVTSPSLLSRLGCAPMGTAVRADLHDPGAPHVEPGRLEIQGNRLDSKQGHRADMHRHHRSAGAATTSGGSCARVVGL